MAKRNVKSRIVWVAVIVIAAALIVAVLELTNTVHWFRNQRATSGTIPATHQITKHGTSTKQTLNSSGNGNTSQNSSSGSISSASPTTTSTSAPKTANQGSAPMAPFGNFVSNHNPTISGSLSSEESVCNTTPGATCYIAFTQNGITKKLPVETADSNGSVFWSWNVGQAGFTTGGWQITAYATLNGQTVSSQDKLLLNVQS